jgi:uncharacterized protein
MRIRVSELSADGVLVEDQLDPARFKELMVLQDDDACHFHGMLTVRLRVIPTAGMFRVEGRVSGAASLPCSRCLAPARWPLQSTFRLTFSRTVPGAAPDSPSDIHELQADELGVVLFEGDEIDFHDVIQEQVIMSLPMQPLCRENCRGLCAGCGANLNDGSCKCPGKGVDPRLAILKRLKLDP